MKIKQAWAIMKERVGIINFIIEIYTSIKVLTAACYSLYLWEFFEIIT